MYIIIKDGAVVASRPSLCWVRKQDNGIFVRSIPTEGQAILVDDAIYAVRGREEIADHETVDIVEVADSVTQGGDDERLGAVEDQLAAIAAAVERGMQ